MAKLYPTFAALLVAVKDARAVAEHEARQNCGNGGFLRSRGVWVVTLNDKDGLIEPRCENFYTGKGPTAAELNSLIERVLANFPQVDSIDFVGGWDFAEQMVDFNDGAYDPWVSEWAVVAWRRQVDRTLDELVRMHSGFDSMKEMVEGTHQNYSPTLATKRGKDEKECVELGLIADAYDAAQKARGDTRRAYRY